MFIVSDDAEESNAMSEGGLSGDDKDDDDRTRQVPELQYSRVSAPFCKLKKRILITCMEKDPCKQKYS